MSKNLLECQDCGWRGEQEECDRISAGIEEPELFCPKCGGQNLMEIESQHQQLNLVPC